jgi:hypothetical protein
MSEENIDLIPITEVELNIPEVAERLFLGPQGALMEQIDNFNRIYCYNEDAIRITKRFKFKPGTYDRIKKAHGDYVLRYRQKANSIWRLADRIQRFDYLNRTFWNDAKRIQRDMQRLSWQNISWQENTALVERFWNEFIERLNTEFAEVAKNFPNSEIKIFIDNNILQDSNNWNSMKMYVDLSTKEINMKVYHLDEIISEYEWGDVVTRWTIPIWSFLNNWCEGGRNSSSSNSMGINPMAKMYPKYIDLLHPYISRHRTYGTSSDSWIHNTCTGDVQSNIGESVWALNLMPLVTHVRNWLSKYHIPNTNPLNRINLCYYGMPPGSSYKLWQHRDSSPETEMSHCRWPGMYSERLRNCTNLDTGILHDPDNRLSMNNPCDECDFRDGYSYERIHGNDSDTTDLVQIHPCSRAIIDYIGPQTEEDAIKEACILHMMVCNFMRSHASMMTNAGYTDTELTEETRFPRDAELSNIYEVVGEDFHFESYYFMELHSWRAQDHEGLMDVVFNAHIWHSLMDDLSYILYGDNPTEDDRYELDEEWNGATLQSIRQEIHRIQTLQEIQANEHQQHPLEEASIADNLTPEERTIRWATRNGSAINI